MKLVMLDSATMGADLDFSVFNVYGEVVNYPSTQPCDVAARLADADIVLVNKIQLGKAQLQSATSLKLICVFATGYDNIDVSYCAANGIAVCNVRGYSTHSVAQLTVAMVLQLIQKMPAYTRYVTSGAYTESGVANCLSPVFCELYGKTWGVVGLGNIGREVAGIAAAFGCRVIACKRTPDPSYPCVDIETLCREADIITLHTPLNAQTRGLISSERIAHMKPNAVLVNVSRGAVTDESALAQALVQNRIGGLGVDVYSTEPFGTDHPFYPLMGDDRLCLTPHMAWGAYEARVRCLNETAQNIDAFLRGERRSRVD